MIHEIIKSITGIFALVVLSACSKQAENTYQFHLANSNKIIQFNMPADFDTLLSWERSSDYSCGDERYYRIQNSDLGIDLEKGYFHYDSLNQFRQLTITHRTKPKCLKIGTLDFNIKSAIKNQQNSIKALTDEAHFTLEDSIHINHRDFAMVGYEEPNFKNPKVLDKKLTYHTIIDSQLVCFEFYSNQPQDTDFFTEMTDVFETIEIKNIDSGRHVSD